MDRTTRERRDRLLAEVSIRPAARLELAELYRAEGHPDQAGRWGISVDGWTTNRERDAYRALLRGRGPDAASMLRRLSGIAPGETLTADARAVIAEAKVAPSAPRQFTGWRASLDICSRWTAGGIAAIGAVVGVPMLFVVFGAAFVGSSDLRMPARLTVTVASFCFAFAAACRLPASILRRQWVRVGVLAAGALVLGAVVVTLAPSPQLRLPWEAP